MARSEAWYKFDDDEMKLIDTSVFDEIPNIDICSECNYAITYEPYQQGDCGTRICKNCYKKLKTEYYCKACIKNEEKVHVHSNRNLFLDKARNNDLKKIKVTCPDCKKKDVSFTELLEHVKTCSEKYSHCPACHTMTKDKNHKCKPLTKASYKVKEIQCPNCNEEIYDIQKHLCPIDWSQCCPFGCPDIEPKKLQNHRETKKLEHLDYLWATLKKNNMTNIADEDIKEIFKNNLVKEVKKSLGIQSSLDDLTKELVELKKAIQDENFLYETLEKNKKKELDDFDATSFDGTIMWRIDNWSKIKEQSMQSGMEDNYKKSIFSPYFFTSRFGYKMCLRLYPNGNETATGIGLSLYLVIMRGKFDNVLSWPFKQKVTFILMDQSFKTNHIDAFVPQEPNPSFSKPRTDMNVPAGSSVFIKHEDMDKYEYVKNDSIFIRCIIDCSDLTDGF